MNAFTSPNLTPENIGKYKIENGLPGYDEKAFGLIAGALGNIPYIIFMIFSGYIVDNFNRKKILLITCLLGGILFLINGRAPHVNVLFFTRTITGAMDALALSSSYAIADDMFPKRL